MFASSTVVASKAMASVTTSSRMVGVGVGVGVGVAVRVGRGVEVAVVSPTACSDDEEDEASGPSSGGRIDAVTLPARRSTAAAAAVTPMAAFFERKRSHVRVPLLHPTIPVMTTARATGAMIGARSRIGTSEAAPITPPDPHGDTATWR